MSSEMLKAAAWHFLKNFIRIILEEHVLLKITIQEPGAIFSTKKKKKKRKKENKKQKQQQKNKEKSSFFICTFLYIISAAGWKMEVFRLTQPDNG